MTSSKTTIQNSSTLNNSPLGRACPERQSNGGARRAGWVTGAFIFALLFFALPQTAKASCVWETVDDCSNTAWTSWRTKASNTSFCKSTDAFKDWSTKTYQTKDWSCCCGPVTDNGCCRNQTTNIVSMVNTREECMKQFVANPLTIFTYYPANYGTVNDLANYKKCEQDYQSQNAVTTLVAPVFEIPDIQIKIPGMAKFSQPNCDPATETCEIPWIGEYIQGLYNYAIWIFGILSAVALMIAGIIWLTSGGSSSQVGEARSWIVASITSLVLILTSYTILEIINKDLVGIGMIKVKYIMGQQKTTVTPNSTNGPVLDGCFPVANRSFSGRSNYGDRRDNGYRCHVGVDNYTNTGGSIVAIASGTITSIGGFYDCDGDGYVIQVRYGPTFETAKQTPFTNMDEKDPGIKNTRTGTLDGYKYYNSKVNDCINNKITGCWDATTPKLARIFRYKDEYIGKNKYGKKYYMDENGWITQAYKTQNATSIFIKHLGIDGKTFYTVNYGEMNTNDPTVKKLLSEFNNGNRKVVKNQYLGQATVCNMLHFELYEGIRGSNQHWYPLDAYKPIPSTANWCALNEGNTDKSQKNGVFIDPTETLKNLKTCSYP